MKKVEDMKLYTLGEIEDELIGPIGTKERDEYEAQLAEELHAYHVGEAIKQARMAQNLTQAQLGEKMGVHKAQICRLESGKSITLTSMMRVFKALGVQVALDVKGIGQVSLC